MDKKVGSAVHLLIEFMPIIWLGYSWMLGDFGLIGFWTKSLIVPLVLMWTYFGTLLLSRFGIMDLIFRMEYLIGSERAFGLSTTSSLVLFIA